MREILASTEVPVLCWDWDDADKRPKLAVAMLGPNVKRGGIVADSRDAVALTIWYDDSQVEVQVPLDKLREALAAAPDAGGAVEQGDGCDLAASIIEVCEARGWSLHWTCRGAYLHLEASELIEAIRGKRGDPTCESSGCTDRAHIDYAARRHTVGQCAETGRPYRGVASHKAAIQGRRIFSPTHPCTSRAERGAGEVTTTLAVCSASQRVL